ncbi:MAG: hypothetical protein KME26_12335 [Oscillatoria princeps RMCB-10]|nr:hypothetical protein [Oscillatoria princeps RMCB-10]
MVELGGRGNFWLARLGGGGSAGAAEIPFGWGKGIWMANLRECRSSGQGALRELMAKPSPLR